MFWQSTFLQLPNYNPPIFILARKLLWIGRSKHFENFCGMLNQLYRWVWLVGMHKISWIKLCRWLSQTVKFMKIFSLS